MAISLYSSGTEYVAWALTLTRGSVDDITSVGVYPSTDPNVIPAVEDFTMVTLADGTTTPPDPLAEAGKVDVVALIGAKTGADLSLEAGDWQMFVLCQTATEDIIRKTDVISVDQQAVAA